MIVPEADATWAADEFIKYFSQMGNIEDYLRFVKKEVIKSTSSLAPLNDEFFNEDIHPQEMEFDIKFVGSRFQQSIPQEHYGNLLRAVSSHNNESNIPGRELRWMVFEKKTQKVLGFIRFGSPTINSKPRNVWLGKAPNLSIFNRHAAMGFVIVPSQPFGYNYLGGKLMAAICNSHDVRRMLNKKYDTEFCLFETTSLYGNIKGGSMYDGMRPFLRYKGDTQSKFLLTLGEELYFELRDWFTEKNDGEDLIHKGASSRKLKMQTKMVGVIKASLKQHDTHAHDLFCSAMDKASGVTTQKRFYMGEYGYTNVRDILLGKTTQLNKAENYDRFELKNILTWWKNKASKRYDNIVADGRVRKKLEIWNADTMNDIDIIR